MFIFVMLCTRDSVYKVKDLMKFWEIGLFAYWLLRKLISFSCPQAAASQLQVRVKTENRNEPDRLFPPALHLNVKFTAFCALSHFI